MYTSGGWPKKKSRKKNIFAPQAKPFCLMSLPTNVIAMVLLD